MKKGTFEIGPMAATMFKASAEIRKILERDRSSQNDPIFEKLQQLGFSINQGVLAAISLHRQLLRIPLRN